MIAIPSTAVLSVAAPLRDSEARFVWYDGNNQSPLAEKEQTSSSSGKARYGYASLLLMLMDPQRRFHIVLLDHVSPANARQEAFFAAQLYQLALFYPSLCASTVAGDAAFGYDVVLSTVHQLRARRVIDIRDDAYSYGHILNVTDRFPSDGSIRLVHDLVVNSPAWKQLYHRARNASEGRNAKFEDLGLKRSPVYGELRTKALIFLTDIWTILTTLGSAHP